jgi:hypothetical protein
VYVLNLPYVWLSIFYRKAARKGELENGTFCSQEKEKHNFIREKGKIAGSFWSGLSYCTRVLAGACLYSST